jgi:hypothetical protein
MDSHYKLSEAEQQSLDGARRWLGSNLSDYLLSGLGETNMTHCRAFTAQTTAADEDVTYRFEMINESPQGLPIGREPLVLAVLLNLLRERRPLDDKVTFRTSDILELLRWPQTIETHLVIKQALEKYTSTAYCLVDASVSEEERRMNLYANFKRVIIGYQTTSKLIHMKRADQQRFIQVEFWRGFLEAIKVKRKQFLGVEFESLRGMRVIDRATATGDV